MATTAGTIRGWTGFEGAERDPLTSIDTSLFVCDGTARTGEWHLRFLVKTAALNSGKCAWAVPTVGQALVDTETAQGVARIFFRINTLPSANDVFISGFGIADNLWHAGLRLKTTGQFFASASTSSGSTSTAALATGRWYRMELTSTLTNPTVGNNTTVVSISVYDDTDTLVETVTASGSNVNTPVSFPTATAGHNDLNSSTYDIDFDDWFWEINAVNGAGATATLPTATRISPVYVNAQGASADWTNSFNTVREIPRDTTAGDEQTVTTNGATTTFQHATADELGLSGIEGLVVYGNLKAASGGTDALVLDGVETSITVTTSYVSILYFAQKYSSISNAAFDALEFGARNKRGVSLQLGKIYGEVLHAGSNYWPAKFAGDASWKHTIVKWNGNGSYQTIAGVGFRPQVVLVKKVTGSTSAGCLKLGQMGGTTSKLQGSAAAYDSRAIMRITDDGFEIGPHASVNQTTAEYVALCLQDGGGHGDGYFLHSGLYIGDGTDNRDIIIASGWAPDLVFSSSQNPSVWKSSTQAGDAVARLDNGTTITDFIQALGGSGFQVGATANAIREQHPYWAIKRGSNGVLNNAMNYGVTTPLTTSFTVTGLTFSPEFVWAKRLAAVDAHWRFETASGHTGTSSSPWNSIPQISTGITAFTSDGWSAGSTLAASGVATHWVAWNANDSVPVIVETRITQMVVLTMAPNIVACPTPDEGENLCLSVDDPILFSSWDPGDGERRWYGETALDDPEDYYGGWKENRLLEVSEVRRALAGTNWDYEVGNFSVTFADEDYAVRTAMGRYFNGREVEVFAVTPDGRDESVTAKTIATGFVDADPSFDDAQDAMSVKLTCRDRIGQAIGWTQTGQSKLPRRVLSAVNLPGCDPAALGLAAPWWYGLLTTNVTASGIFAPPVHDVDPTHCGAFDGPYPAAGWANWNNPPAAMGTVTATTLPGGELSLHTPHDEGRYYVQVFPVASNGDVGDPFPFCMENLFADVTAGNQTIEASWATVSGAASYIALLSVFYYGVRPQQYIKTTALSCQFTKSPDWMQEGNIWDLITPGARPPEDSFIWYAHVRSRNGNVLSELSASKSFAGVSFQAGFQCSNGARFRPQRIWWQTAGAPTYEVLSKGPGGPITSTEYEWKWIVPSGQFDVSAGLHYFDQDFLYLDAIPLGAEEARPQGKIKPFYTRDVVLPDTDTWREFLIAGTAIQDVDDWYYDPNTGPIESVEINQGDGTEWLWPKTGGAWYSKFVTSYRDIVGIDGVARRYSVGYGRGPKADLVASGTSMITLNIRGIETSAAGTGTLITDLHDQFLHFLRNAVVASGEGYMTGAWSEGATMGFSSICVINEESFVDLKTMRQEEYPGGFITAGGIGANGAQIDVTEALKQFMESGDFRIGPNRFWQIAGFALDENLTAADLSDPITDQFDIHVRTMKPFPKLAELQNVLPYRYNRNFVNDDWSADNQRYTNDDSVSRWRVAQLAEFTEFHFITDPSLSQFVIQKIARRRGDAPTYITLEGSVCLMSPDYDVGRYFPITHWRGVQVPSGYVNRPLWILSSTFNPATRRVRLECQDVAYLVPSGAGGLV